MKNKNINSSALGEMLFLIGDILSPQFPSGGSSFLYNIEALARNALDLLVVSGYYDIDGVIIFVKEWSEKKKQTKKE